MIYYNIQYAVTTKLECKQAKAYKLKDILTATILKRTPTISILVVLVIN